MQMQGDFDPWGALYACYESQHKIPEEQEDIEKRREDNGTTMRSPPLANRGRVLD